MGTLVGMVRSTVRALLVVLGAERIEDPLLGTQVGRRRCRRLRFQRPMEALKPPVLLGMARCDPLGHDP